MANYVLHPSTVIACLYTPSAIGAAVSAYLCSEHVILTYWATIVGGVTSPSSDTMCHFCAPVFYTFSNHSVASPTSQLILLIRQLFRRFIYVTAHYPTLPSLHLRHNLFSNPSVASPTSLALHLCHLASRPWARPPPEPNSTSATGPILVTWPVQYGLFNLINLESFMSLYKI